MMTTKTFPEWEQELDAWETTFKPETNHFNGSDKFETYGEELDYVRSVYDVDPRRVWTLVDGDDGNLYIVDGFHLVNRINYFVTKVPFEGKFLEVPYCIFDEKEDEENEDI
jgi:hypothetical protein